MKFTLILVALASAATIKQSSTPDAAYKGRAANLKEGLEVIKKQNEFEAKHEATHAKAMEKANAEMQKLTD